MKTLMMPTLMLAVGISAKAMTQTELQSAIDRAASGDTIYVTSDLEYSSPLVVDKQLTIASEAGKSYVIRRAASYANGNFLDFPADSTADLTLENITVDGNKASGSASGQFIYMNGGKLTLSQGAVLRDYYSIPNGTISLLGTSTLVMHDGAVISGFENTSYGVAVRASSSGGFIMDGGLITGCRGHFGSERQDYDGVVYIYGGNFTATGGTIAGNTSDNAVAGILCFSGTFGFGGGFTVTNNVGKTANDVFIRHTSVLQVKILSDYTGWMTVKFDSYWTPTEGWQVPLITTEADVPRQGCLNIVAEDDPTIGCGFESLYQNVYGIWRKIEARIEGRRNERYLQDALDHAIAGDTIVLCKNLYLTGTKSITKDMTIRGESADISVLRNANCLCLFDVSGARLRLENIVLNGQRTIYSATSSSAGWLISAMSGGVIELGPGCVVKSSVAWARASAAWVEGAGSKLIMEDGSLITDCLTDTASGAAYGSAIVTRSGGAFEMKGGLITGCDCSAVNLPTSGYNGIVYNYGGTINLSGGAITGNTSAVGCSGVVNYSGTIRVTGSARVDDDNCPYPGIYGAMTYYGDFRGRVGVSKGNQGRDETAVVTAESADATGAWCFYPSLTAASRAYVGRAEGVQVKWADPIGAVNGVNAATSEELALLLPAELDLSADSTDWKSIPIVLTGAATALEGQLTVSYDPLVLLASGRLPAELISAGDGETLTGVWNFDLPAYKKGSWTVASTGRSLVLDYAPPGLTITFQ